MLLDISEDLLNVHAGQNIQGCYYKKVFVKKKNFFKKAPPPPPGKTNRSGLGQIKKWQLYVWYSSRTTGLWAHNRTRYLSNKKQGCQQRNCDISVTQRVSYKRN
jgi:hypothetical protein